MSFVERARGLVNLARIALVTRTPVRFLVRQARRAPNPRGYRLRRSDLTIAIRHGTSDLNTFDEVFLQRQYEPPREVNAALRSLGRPLTLADLGANVGLASSYLCSRLPVERILAVEPDRANAEVLRRMAQANENLEIAIIEACAGCADGTAPFLQGGFALSRIARPDETGAAQVPMVDILPRLAGCDLLKLDVEGAEWRLLADKRFARLPAIAIVLEYHPYLCPAPDARREATRVLSETGYEVHPVMHKADGAGVLWGWRASPVSHPGQQSP